MKEAVKKQVTIRRGPLTFDDVLAVAARRAEIVLDPEVLPPMRRSRAVVETALTEGQVVYGVTTGFGALANTRIDPTEASALQLRLVRSHAAGVGDPLPDPLVRAMLLLRARTLAQGYSGVRPLVVERYLDFLRLDLLPAVPDRGSVGASGDLAPFAHLALPLVGEGLLRVDGVVTPAREALERAGLKPIVLEAKEGLSLLNGTEGMLAWGVLALDRARRLTRAADIACALSIEALMGSARPFRPEIHALRPHPGQIDSARNVARLVQGSGIGSSHADDFTHAVQDAYSLRCAPQVHGACRDALSHAANVFERELGAIVDNPIILFETGEVISAGNFHGQPLAVALDLMAIALTDLASISERRIDRMLDPGHSSGLPAFLAVKPGLMSGYMLAQYTAAALVAECRVLSHPASVESIPTSGSQEDHVSMGWGAARKLWEVLESVTRVLAVELLCAAQGVEFRAPLEPAPSTGAALGAVRAIAPRLVEDRPLGEEIEAMTAAIERGDVERTVESVSGPLA